MKEKLISDVLLLIFRIIWPNDWILVGHQIYSTDNSGSILLWLAQYIASNCLRIVSAKIIYFLDKFID